MSRPEILAVHQRKLKEFLEGLGLWEPLTTGELKCTICGTQITIDNIGLVIPSGEQILVCCSKAECLLKAKELRRASNEN